MKAVAHPRAHSGAGHYVVVWLVLLVLTTVTWLLGKVHLGDWNVVVALTIAGVKGMLVLLIFMHLLQHKGASYFAVATAFAFIALLTGLTLTDVIFRYPIATPPGSWRANQSLEKRQAPPPGSTPSAEPPGIGPPPAAPAPEGKR